MRTYTQFILRKRLIKLISTITFIFSSILVYGSGPITNHYSNFDILYPFMDVELVCNDEIRVFGPLTAEQAGYMVTETSSSVQIINLPAGSMIVDMGVTPQTEENGLKPYGLLYSLLENHTPLVWAIDQTKVKDGIDFSVDGRDFRGGPFIISQIYLTSDVLNEISDWEALGVVTYQALTNFDVPQYKILDAAPRWTINDVNENIIIQYLDIAEIPEFDSNGDPNYVVKLASQLNGCDDLFVMPHDDSQNWTDEGEPLYEWNKSFANGGSGLWFWAGCKAVSQVEALVDPNDSSRRTNFLAEDPNPYPDPGFSGDGYGLVDSDDHDDASGNLPYLASFHEDPFMQFMGQTDEAHDGGAEQIYLPYPTGAWRSTTKIAAWDPNQSDLGSISPGEAALIAYGHGFGDASRGMVMYEAGHRLDNGTEQENVAAIRAFFNFSFEAAQEKKPLIVDNASLPNPIILEEGDSVQFDITATTAPGAEPITYEWTTNCCASGHEAYCHVIYSQR
jgi:hypothetical protein